MMLAKRVIPSMLVRGRTLVKGQRYDSWRSIGHALQAAKIHASRGVDELLILDISATAENRGPDLTMVEELSAGCFIPITVGGGVRTLDDIRNLLLAGADKVAIGTAAVEVEGLLEQASSRFGNQAIVVSLDVVADHGLRIVRIRSNGYTPLGRRPSSDPAAWARLFEKLGAGEILLSSIDRDGMMQGYDLDLIREVSQSVDIPVIASGGCGSYEHMLEAFRAGADACAAGAMFAFTDQTPRGAAQFLKSHGLEVRL